MQKLLDSVSHLLQTVITVKSMHSSRDLYGSLSQLAAALWGTETVGKAKQEEGGW